MRFLIISLFAVSLLAACAPREAEVTDVDTGTGADEPFESSDVGYFTAFYDIGDDGLRSVDVDLIEWYTGADAARAAKQDDPSCPGECKPPNGFYVRNAQQDTFTFEVANDARVYLHSEDRDDPEVGDEVTYEEFLNKVSSNGRILQRYQVTPFWISHEDGVITEIKEQYLP